MTCFIHQSQVNHVSGYKCSLPKPKLTGLLTMTGAGPENKDVCLPLNSVLDLEFPTLLRFCPKMFRTEETVE
jgi:hypothetical protein